MDVDFKVDKTIAFFHWVQLLSDWDNHKIEPYAFEYYRSMLNNLTKGQASSLVQIKGILQNSSSGIKILSELYSDKFSSDEVREIAELSKSLERPFETEWQNSIDNINEWRERLKAVDFKHFRDNLEKISQFFDSDINLEDEYTIYLLNNPPKASASGHSVALTRYFLFHPPGRDNLTGIEKVVTAIMHEYVHAIEQRSKTARALYLKSFNEHISDAKSSKIKSINWKMMYVEAMTFCFAEPIFASGAIFRVNNHENSVKSPDELSGLIDKMKKTNPLERVQDFQIYAGLSILPEALEYLHQGKKIDYQIVDRLSNIFLSELIDSF